GACGSAPAGQLPAALGRRGLAFRLVFRRSHEKTFRQRLRKGFMRFLIFLFIGSVFAQDYPARPITAIVPFSAGSASDVIARIMLERMGTSMGQRFIVDNRPAAGGVAGTSAAAKMPADGYTVIMGASGPMVVNKVLNP